MVRGDIIYKILPQFNQCFNGDFNYIRVKFSEYKITSFIITLLEEVQILTKLVHAMRSIINPTQF